MNRCSCLSTFSFDKDGRVARMVAKGVLETEVEPIKNPVTGEPHRIQVVMPEGFEHKAAEVASANIRSTGAIKFDTKGIHSSLATSSRRRRVSRPSAAS